MKTEGFSENRKFATAEDYEFMIRIAQEGELRFIQKPLAKWHVHGGNTSGNAAVHARALVNVVEFHLAEWIEEHPEMKEKVRRRRGDISASAGHLLLLGRDFTEAKQYAIKALSHHPFSWKAWAVLFLSAVHVPV